MQKHQDILSTNLCMQPDSEDEIGVTKRRQFLSSSLFVLTSSFVVNKNPFQALAVMDSSQDNAKVFKAGIALGKEAAIERFKLGRKDLKYLLDNYSSITPDGGDGVRRYLGTVGVSSGLYGITKVLKELQDEAEDIVEYTESMNDFNAYLSAADTACYSANFVEFSAAKTKPEKFLDDAKMDAEMMLKNMNKMAAELGI